MLSVLINLRHSPWLKEKSISGYLEEFPQLDQPLNLITYRPGYRASVKLGTIINIRYYGETILVQTEQVVAEVILIAGNSGNSAKVFSLIPQMKKPRHFLPAKLPPVCLKNQLV